MNIWHLIWIVPAAVAAGFCMAALLCAGDGGKSGGSAADDKTEEDR